jgi:hypothetical protein
MLCGIETTNVLNHMGKQNTREATDAILSHEQLKRR